MSDQPAHFTIHAHVSHALWPGDGLFCGRVSSSVFAHDQFYLVDRNDRVSELRPYRYGMLREVRR